MFSRYSPSQLVLLHKNGTAGYFQTEQRGRALNWDNHVSVWIWITLFKKEEEKKVLNSVLRQDVKYILKIKSEHAPIRLLVFKCER